MIKFSIDPEIRQQYEKQDLLDFFKWGISEKKLTEDDILNLVKLIEIEKTANCLIINFMVILGISLICMGLSYYFK